MYKGASVRFYSLESSELYYHHTDFFHYNLLQPGHWPVTKRINEMPPKNGDSLLGCLCNEHNFVLLI